MKKIFLLLVILFTIKGSQAQITLDYVVDSVSTGDQFYWTDIGNNDIKYVKLNFTNNSFSLYNLNMTPYMLNIPIPYTGSNTLANGFTVMYVTKSLFDCDSTNIEYAYSNPIDPTKPFFIYRTNGTLLFQEDSANGPYCYGCYGGSVTIQPISNTPIGTKLYLQKQDSHSQPELLIYSLCGQLPTDVFDFSQNNHSYVSIFPNPTSKELNFEIHPPNNQDEYQLVIYDNSLKEQTRKSCSNQVRVTLDISSLASGSYLYSFVGKNRVYQTGKFIISK